MLLDHDLRVEHAVGACAYRLEALAALSSMVRRAADDHARPTLDLQLRARKKIWNCAVPPYAVPVGSVTDLVWRTSS